MHGTASKSCFCSRLYCDSRRNTPLPLNLDEFEMICPLNAFIILIENILCLYFVTELFCVWFNLRSSICMQGQVLLFKCNSSKRGKKPLYVMEVLCLDLALELRSPVTLVKLLLRGSISTL